MLLTKCKKNKTMTTYLRDPAVALKWWEEIKDVETMEKELRMLKNKTVYRPEIKWAVNHFILSKDFITEWLIGEGKEKWRKDFEDYVVKIYKNYGVNDRTRNLLTNSVTYNEVNK